MDLDITGDVANERKHREPAQIPRGNVDGDTLNQGQITIDVGAELANQSISPVWTGASKLHNHAGAQIGFPARRLYGELITDTSHPIRAGSGGVRYQEGQGKPG